MRSQPPRTSVGSPSLRATGFEPATSAQSRGRCARLAGAEKRVKEIPGKVLVRYLKLFVCVLALVTMPMCLGTEERCSRASDCADGNECTEEGCRFMYGGCGGGALGRKCVYRVVPDGASCDFDGQPGVCQAGVCRPDEGTPELTGDGGVGMQGKMAHPSRCRFVLLVGPWVPGHLMLCERPVLSTV
jgi:hypothetical protein